MIYFDKKVTHSVQKFLVLTLLVNLVLIHYFLSPLSHKQIQIYRQHSILENFFMQPHQTELPSFKKKKSTQKHRRLGSKFCEPQLSNLFTNKENTLT